MKVYINACKGGHIDIVHLIMSIGYFDGINESFNEGFKYACLEGHIEIVRSKNVNLNLNSGLIRACEGGHIDIVNLIISKADI
jgi:hypothetical protein